MPEVPILTYRSGRVVIRTSDDGHATITSRLEGSLETRWGTIIDYNEAGDIMRACAQWRQARRSQEALRKPIDTASAGYESGSMILFETEDGLAEIGGDPDKIFIGGDPKKSVAIFVSPAGAVELISALAQWLVRRTSSS